MIPKREAVALLGGAVGLTIAFFTEGVLGWAGLAAGGGGVGLALLWQHHRFREEPRP